MVVSVLRSCVFARGMRAQGTRVILLTFIVVLSSPPVFTSLSFVFWHIVNVQCVLVFRELLKL